jgi:hypothetical protein
MKEIKEIMRRNNIKTRAPIMVDAIGKGWKSDQRGKIINQLVEVK